MAWLNVLTYGFVAKYMQGTNFFNLNNLCLLKISISDKCTAPNNTKLNGDTTMTVGNSNGNPYGTIQRHSATLRRPINNGFATLEQHPHNTLRYV